MRILACVIIAAACCGCLGPVNISPVLSANLNLYNRGGVVESGATKDSKATSHEAFVESEGGGAMRVAPSIPSATVVE